MSELTADSWITPLRVKSCGIKLSGPEKIVCEAQMDDVGGGVYCGMGICTGTGCCVGFMNGL